MITGKVTAGRAGVVRLTVHGPDGPSLRVTAVIDTGYDGRLSLPPEVIRRLQLPWRRRGRAVLADGSEIGFNVYRATVFWDRHPRLVAVDEADTNPLIGMALLDGYELTMEIRAGGKVTLRPLPRRRRA